MLRVDIINDRTGKNGLGNYKITVLINNTILYEGKYKGHQRSLGWEKLLLEIVGKIVTDQNIKWAKAYQKYKPTYRKLK